jgi:predicted permease
VTPLLARLVPASLPVAQAPSVDPRAMLFAAALTVLTGVLFGAFPAWRAARDLELGGLASGGRSGTRRARARYALVAVEVAMSVVLLVSAGLLLRALLNLQQLDLGFRTDGVLTVRTALPSPEYDVTARRAAFYEAVLGEVKAIPGVEHAAYITSLPVAGIGGVWAVIPENGARGPRVERAASRFVTPTYFAAMGIPLLRGRDVATTDGPGETLVAVVSASFAQRYWPDEEAIGRRFKFPEDLRTVVGVVGDVGFRGPEQRSEPQVYLPYRQVQDGQSLVYSPKDLVIRSNLQAAALVPMVRDIVRRVDPRQPVSDVRPMEAIVDNATQARATQVTILVTFAALGALLAAVGIHGLLAYTVSSRQHEIGVRLALGAQRRDVVRLVMREAGLLAAAGVVPGIAVAYAVARAMQGLLAGVEPGDVATYLAVALLCSGMVAIGSLAPTLRASRVDPAGALRAEA